MRVLSGSAFGKDLESSVPTRLNFKIYGPPLLCIYFPRSQQALHIIGGVLLSSSWLLESPSFIGFCGAIFSIDKPAIRLDRHHSHTETEFFPSVWNYETVKGRARRYGEERRLVPVIVVLVVIFSGPCTVVSAYADLIPCVSPFHTHPYAHIHTHRQKGYVVVCKLLCPGSQPCVAAIVLESWHCH